VAADLHHREPTRQVEGVIANGLIASGDPRLLRLVLDNLLGNAWKFTSTMGWARIEVGRQSVPNGTVGWFVRDNGVGFDMAFVKRLFGAFQRLHQETEFPGTGIGLATVQRIIHRHGGRVWAESAVHQGATFSCTLPAGDVGPEAGRGGTDR
jgi:light-regulated signal transduction histidine kinase (bacteriophytochrome)